MAITSYGRPYGWRPSLPDFRDLNFSAIEIPTKPIVLPPLVDLREHCSPVEDQGKLGSCTANALVGAMEFLENKNDTRFEDLSRLFVYYNERKIEKTIKYDSGAALRDGIKSLKTEGVCTEELWPYNINVFQKSPSAAAKKDGIKRVILSYAAISTIHDMKVCLASGFPFVFGFTVYDSFESLDVANDGIVPMPVKNEHALGGHAVMAVGYNDATGRFLVRNSWGSSWGMEGYFTMPYEYLLNPDLATDFWYINKALGV